MHAMLDMAAAVAMTSSSSTLSSASNGTVNMPRLEVSIKAIVGVGERTAGDPRRHRAAEVVLGVEAREGPAAREGEGKGKCGKCRGRSAQKACGLVSNHGWIPVLCLSLSLRGIGEQHALREDEVDGAAGIHLKHGEDAVGESQVVVGDAVHGVGEAFAHAGHPGVLVSLALRAGDRRRHLLGRAGDRFAQSRKQADGERRGNGLTRSVTSFPLTPTLPSSPTA